jgi:4'-phosphopantetheinyl transferase
MRPALPRLDDLATRVHIVLAAQEAPDVVEALPVLRAVLSADEQARELRYRLPADRVRFVVGRGLARHLLGQVLSLAPADIAIETEAHGRPVLAPHHPHGVGFNVSHTPGLVAVAITDTRDVGIDVEDTARAITHDIPSRFFSPAEVHELQAHPAAAQASAFFDYWTLKEAYIKARGLGLAIPLDQFSFHLAPQEPPVLTLDPRQDDTADRWQFHLASPTTRHRLALAVSRGDITTRAVRVWWFGARPA